MTTLQPAPAAVIFDQPAAEIPLAKGFKKTLRTVLLWYDAFDGAQQMARQAGKQRPRLRE